MTRIVRSIGGAAVALGAFLCAAAAAPLLNQTFVSAGSGIDTPGCGGYLSAPCQSIQGAYGRTIPYGEIDILDSGLYGSVTIQHGITIVNKSGATASVRTSASLRRRAMACSCGD